MIALDLYQGHYQVLLIIYLNDFIVISAQTVNFVFTIFRCFDCKKKNCKKNFHKKLIKKIINIYEFCNEEINIFVLLLRKGNYPFEYMVAWKDLMEQHILMKKIFK